MIQVNTNRFHFVIAAMLLSFGSAQAQQAKEYPQDRVFIARFTPGRFPCSSTSSACNAFRQALHQSGHIDGENILIEQRYADGRLERLPALAEELVRLERHSCRYRSTGPRCAESDFDDPDRRGGRWQSYSKRSGD